MSFNITVQPSGRTFAADSGETLLAAGLRQGVGLPYGCKDGACGSCKCLKVSGEVVMGEHQSKALSEDEKAQGYVLTCRATAQSDLVLTSRQVVEEGSFPIRKMPVRVLSLNTVSDDVMVVTLQLPSNDAFGFRAGQYIDFLLRDGARRSYSMANAPHTLVKGSPTVELHIRHMPGGVFTDQVFGSMKEKDIQRVEGPQGSFFLREDSQQPLVFLASGTGFAPIKAMLEHMRHAQIQRPTTLYWGGRRPSDLYMDAWVREQATDLPWLTYVPVVSDALPTDHWSGRTGFVHLAVLQDFADLSQHQVYACGAPVVVDSARADFVAKAQLPMDAFYADSFITEADKAKS